MKSVGREERGMEHFTPPWSAPRKGPRLSQSEDPSVRDAKVDAKIRITQQGPSEGREPTIIHMFVQWYFGHALSEGGCKARSSKACQAMWAKEDSTPILGTLHPVAFSQVSEFGHTASPIKTSSATNRGRPLELTNTTQRAFNKRAHFRNPEFDEGVSTV